MPEEPVPEESVPERKWREEKENPATPEQAAALNVPKDEAQRGGEHPQDETESPMFDTEQHSDAPGPFGTS